MTFLIILLDILIIVGLIRTHFTLTRHSNLIQELELGFSSLNLKTKNTNMFTAAPVDKKKKIE